MGEARHRRLVELNTIEQVVNVCRTTIINDARARGQQLTVHGWAYGVHDGKRARPGHDDQQRGRAGWNSYRSLRRRRVGEQRAFDGQRRASPPMRRSLATCRR